MNRAVCLLFVSRRALRNLPIRVTHIRRTFILGDEARGIACSIEFHHAAIQKLEPRLMCSTRSPKWHFPRRVTIQTLMRLRMQLYGDRREFRQFCFPPRSDRMEEWSIAYLRAKSRYCVAWETGLPTTRRGMQLCLLGKSGQIPVYTVTKRTT